MHTSVPVYSRLLIPQLSRRRGIHTQNAHTQNAHKRSGLLPPPDSTTFAAQRYTHAKCTQAFRFTPAFWPRNFSWRSGIGREIGTQHLVAVGNKLLTPKMWSFHEMERILQHFVTFLLTLHLCFSHISSYSSKISHMEARTGHGAERLGPWKTRDVWGLGMDGGDGCFSSGLWVGFKTEKVVSNLFVCYVHPEIWGNDSGLMTFIFQMGGSTTY